MALGTQETPQGKITLPRLVFARAGVPVFPNRFRKDEIGCNHVFFLNELLA